MVTRVIMPKLGMTMTEGRVIRWLKHEGDVVRPQDALMEVATDKVTTEVESPGGGVLKKILAPEDSSVPCGSVVAIIAEETDDISALLAEVERPQVDAVGLPGETKAREVRASPAARRLAAELGVKLENVVGTGREGRITEDDVRLASTQRADPQSTDGDVRPSVDAEEKTTTLPIDGMRAVIAHRMSKSARETARVVLVSEVCVEQLRDVKNALNRHLEKNARTKVTYTDLMVWAAARSLKNHPKCNASWAGTHIELRSRVNVGVAVDVGDGLLVPVIKDADRIGIFEIAEVRERLVSGARSRDLPPDAFEGGTFTVTNLGAYGVDFFTPIINLPESLILGVGRIAERPAVRDGRIVPTLTVHLSLVFDHRVVDGAPAARLLSDICTFLEEPMAALVGSL